MSIVPRDNYNIGNGCAVGGYGERITVSDVSADTSVANHFIAKLMYYLACIQSVTTLDFGALSDYKNYSI